MSDIKRKPKKYPRLAYEYGPKQEEIKNLQIHPTYILNPIFIQFAPFVANHNDLKSVPHFKVLRIA